MTNVVTPTDVLVLSPVDYLERPTQTPEIFDGYLRVVEALRDGHIGFQWDDDGVLLVCHPHAPEWLFRMTPLLRDGATVPYLVPESWHARVTADVVAAYFRAEWLYFRRDPSWGARVSFEHLTRVEDGVEVEGQLPARYPLVDPLRDTARMDDDATLPLTPVLDGAFADLLTGWEHVDGHLATSTPGPAWLARRSARVVVNGDRWWWEVRGWRDAGDGHRYRGEEYRPLSITAYLGWPAYFVAAAGQTSRCPACGRIAIQGRRYCGAAECDRRRAAARQRVSRGRRPG